MSGSVARPSPVRDQIVNSLMMTPPSLDHLADLLGKVAASAGWTAWAIRPSPAAGCSDPDDELLRDAETDLLNAYLAVYAMRGRI